MRKAKAKKAGASSSKKGGDSKGPAPATEDGPPSPATTEPTVAEAPEKKEEEDEEKEKEVKEEEPQEQEQPTEKFPSTSEDAGAAEPAPAATTPSLAQQSKARSTSFRQGSGSISINAPLSPGAGGAAGLGLLSPEGETAPDIYRKHVQRIEELEKENKALAKELKDAEKRWQKAEGELADLREGESTAAGGNGAGEVDKLVRRLVHGITLPAPMANHFFLLSQAH